MITIHIKAIIPISVFYTTLCIFSALKFYRGQDDVSGDMEELDTEAQEKAECKNPKISLLNNMLNVSVTDM